MGRLARGSVRAATTRPPYSLTVSFASAAARVKNREALVERIEAITSTNTRAHWLAKLEAHGIPCGPINTYAEAFADPQVAAREMVVEIEHPTLGRMRTLGSPIKMSETPPAAGRRVPRLGEDTEAVLREIGMSDREIAEVRRP